jgi:hypothetical protein
VKRSLGEEKWGFGDGGGDSWDLGVLGYAMGMVFKKAWRHVIGRVVQDCFPVPVEKSYSFFYQ